MSPISVPNQKSIPHEDRTASEPRAADLHPVRVRSVVQVNPEIRLFRLASQNEQGIKFRPGQWLDVHVPSVPKAGGFTISSPPEVAVPRTELSDEARKALEKVMGQNADDSPYVELAVQRSPMNPPAAWLWQTPETAMGEELTVRVGGSFVWPPPGIPPETIETVIFIAGGVGINPLISILTHLAHSHSLPRHVHFLYSTKSAALIDPAALLFLPRLAALTALHPQIDVQLFLTGFTRNSASIEKLLTPEYDPVRLQFGRISREAVATLVEGKGVDVGSAVAYVCGPPMMTDSVVEWLWEMGWQGRVFSEKWW